MGYKTGLRRLPASKTDQGQFGNWEYEVIYIYSDYGDEEDSAGWEGQRLLDQDHL